MDDKKKEKLKKAGKIVGSAAWNGVKGWAKVSIAMGKDAANTTTGGDRLTHMQHMREKEKGMSEFGTAWSKLKQLKNLDSDATAEELMNQVNQPEIDYYDEELANPTSMENYYKFYHEDGSEIKMYEDENK